MDTQKGAQQLKQTRYLAGHPHNSGILTWDNGGTTKFWRAQYTHNALRREFPRHSAQGPLMYPVRHGLITSQSRLRARPPSSFAQSYLIRAGAFIPMGPNAYRSRSISYVSSFSTVSKLSILSLDPIRVRALCVRRDPALMFFFNTHLLWHKFIWAVRFPRVIVEAVDCEIVHF